jgi:two-component system nitrogen regulation sensor histidine kinase NtrY
VTISIRDHGIGIPADRLDDIFVPFYSTKVGGSGVGLPLARQVAALRDGTLAVKPVTRGSCSQMHLPSSLTI